MINYKQIEKKVIQKNKMDLKIKENNHRKFKNNTPVVLSASKINLYYECPLKYYFEYLYNWETKPVQVNWPGNGFGKATHKLLEYVMINKKNDNDDNSILNYIKENKLWTQYFDSWLKKKKKDGTLAIPRGYSYKKTIEKGEKYSFIIAKNLLYGSEGTIDIFPEENFEILYDYLDRVSLRGIIDLTLVFKNSNYDILDFKTTKHGEKFYFINWFKDIQSLMYTYYCFKKFNCMPDSFYYLVLDHEKKIVFAKSVDLAYVKDVKKYFTTLTKLIKEVRDYAFDPDIDRVNPSSENCRWCDYKGYCRHKYTTTAGKILKKILR